MIDDVEIRVYALLDWVRGNPPSDRQLPIRRPLSMPIATFEWHGRRVDGGLVVADHGRLQVA
jgi:hypothetical protein